MVTEKITVVFDVAGACEFQRTKALNEFLRNSYRDYAASWNIIDYEVVDGRVCTGCGDNNKQQGESV